MKGSQIKESYIKCMNSIINGLYLQIIMNVIEINIKVYWKEKKQKRNHVTENW